MADATGERVCPQTPRKTGVLSQRIIEESRGRMEVFRNQMVRSIEAISKAVRELLKARRLADTAAEETIRTSDERTCF